jgi:hypothetical protein
VFTADVDIAAQERKEGRPKGDHEKKGIQGLESPRESCLRTGRTALVPRKNDISTSWRYDSSSHPRTEYPRTISLWYSSETYTIGKARTTQERSPCTTYSSHSMRRNASSVHWDSDGASAVVLERGEQFRMCVFGFERIISALSAPSSLGRVRYISDSAEGNMQTRPEASSYQIEVATRKSCRVALRRHLFPWTGLCVHLTA